MPVYKLSEEPVFPHPELARKDGLLAIGGDLSPRRLMEAYCHGIFPWYTEGDPILWWSPNPRTIIFPRDIRISKSTAKVIRKGCFQISWDTGFREVITSCGENRPDGTWICSDMVEAYCQLHSMNIAHSVEVWNEGRLVGGLYGVSLGKCFFGESMFSRMDNASKIALITLARKLEEENFIFIDCQMHTGHLESMGAVDIPREQYLRLLAEGLKGIVNVKQM